MEANRPSILDYLSAQIHDGLDEQGIKEVVITIIDESLPFELSDSEYALLEEHIEHFLDCFMDDAYAQSASEDYDAREEEREYQEAKKGEY